jgi:hypothetical protein
MLKLPPESNSIRDFVESVSQLVSITTRDEANNRRVPELRTGEGGDEVDGTDEEDTFNWSWEGGQV